MSEKNKWLRARKKLIKEAEAEGKITTVNGTVEGICKDCKHWHHLTPDHELKRSLGGGHDKSNIGWVCNEPPCWCHDKRDNRGDPMGKKSKSKKAKWEMDHKCSCGQIVSMLLCPYCGKISIKTTKEK